MLYDNTKQLLKCGVGSGPDTSYDKSIVKSELARFKNNFGYALFPTTGMAYDQDGTTRTLHFDSDGTARDVNIVGGEDKPLRIVGSNNSEDPGSPFDVGLRINPSDRYVGPINADLVLDGTSLQFRGSGGQMVYGADSRFSTSAFFVGGLHGSIGNAFWVQDMDGTQQGTPTNGTLVKASFGTTITIMAGALYGATYPRAFEVDAWGTYSTTTVCGTAEFKVRLGGADLLTTGAQNISCSQTDREWHLHGVFMSRTSGASGKVYAQGLFEHSTTSDQLWLTWAMKNTAETTVDTTVANDLRVTVTLNTTGNTVKCNILNVRVL